MRPVLYRASHFFNYTVNPDKLLVLKLFASSDCLKWFKLLTCISFSIFFSFQLVPFQGLPGLHFFKYNKLKCTNINV